MPAELRKRLVDLFGWIDPGPGATHLVSDISGWWRDPATLAALGPALVAPFRAARPTVVVSPAVTGFLLGPLAATALGVGFVAAHKPGDGRLPAGPLTWAQSPPDFRGRQVDLAIHDRHLGPGDRALVVDDWVATAAQVRAIYEICAARGAEPVGTATIVATCPPPVAEELRIIPLLTPTDLPT
ncbi:phosphoribosyltransferase family protein [Micromonospora sp. WMMD1082]|uniref:phosphoribosyltransferase family protein n=1 Tax=Micromonospora sp. WMMD1082 TaxID=3016104 RepID=UPI002416448A|nr:phosphoribosyltransferase family protein [Micromonospora sp. WMMD1082]MDG4794812.1 phosphoribosyltransferase family protein [Micromonospora sp. WMMD1082]